jgi:hypothetical protein
MYHFQASLYGETKGRFAQQLSLKKIKDSNILVGQEQKFVIWTFTLKPTSKGQCPPNAYITILFVSFGAKNLVSGLNFSTILMEIQVPLKEQIFFFKLVQTPQLYILINFYFVLLRGVFPRSFQPDSSSEKRP